jgi:protein-tyrosine phosphatase
MSVAEPLYEIAHPAPGRLATMAHPRGRAALDGQMAALRSAGVDVLVSALRPDECEWLGLTDEAGAARRAGLEFVSLPIVDADVPAPEQADQIRRLADHLADQVRQGRFVVTHCRAGIGRCSMLAGTVLIRLGLTPDDAWERIRTARGYRVPDNQSQEAWLHEFAANHRDQIRRTTD